MPGDASDAIKIFVSYSHKDEVLREKLGAHLSLLKRQGFIDEWHDRRIAPGREWAGEIDDNLNSAAIILLLVSPDFLASDYCYDREMKRALERHDAGEARVIPVILRKVDWEGAPFSRLQALPRDGKPVRSWSDEDEAFFEVAQGIRKSVEASVRIQQKRQQSQIDAIMRTMLTLFLETYVTTYEWLHLQNMARDQPFHADVHANFVEELRRLLGLGLIARRPGQGIRSLQAGRPSRDVKDHFEITDAGLRILKLRDELAAEEERQRRQAADSAGPEGRRA